MADTLLELERIETCYGLSQVLFGVSLAVSAGEMVTLMGRNGMGKTTTVRSIMGLTPAMAGAVRFAGEDIRTLPSFRIAQRGIGLVPEGRQVFPNLSTRENLVATAANHGHASDPWTLDRVCQLFPRLAERRKLLLSEYPRWVSWTWTRRTVRLMVLPAVRPRSIRSSRDLEVISTSSMTAFLTFQSIQTPGQFPHLTRERLTVTLSAVILMPPWPV